MRIIDNEPCLSRSYLIDLSPDELTQAVCHYPFFIYFDKFNESYSSLDDRKSRICVLNKTEDVN